MLRTDLRHALAGLGLVACAALVASPAAAVVLYDQNVTNAVIFGSGNANGSFTVNQQNGIELGLRGKLRFDAANQPQNQFNSNGDGSYSFDAGQPVGGGFGFAPNSPSTAVWNFEWSINTDYTGGSGLLLDDLTYEIGIDFDPTIGTNYLVFDPINQAIADHAIGTNGTGSGGGAVAATDSEYTTLIAFNNLAQNSWNMEFFDSGLYPFDANVDGTYEIYLAAFQDGVEVARTSITIHNGAAALVPEPSSTLLFPVALVLAGATVPRSRRKKLAS